MDMLVLANQENLRTSVLCGHKMQSREPTGSDLERESRNN